MSIAAIVRALVAAGATPEMILAAVEAAEGSQQDALAVRRANDAKRAREYRERHVTSRDVTVMAVIDGGKESIPHTPLKEITTTNPPSSPTGTQTPKGVRQAGAALPENWSPNPSDAEYATSKGLTVEEFASVCEEFRDWAAANRNRPIGRKADWEATLRGFVRRFAERRARAGPRASPGKSMNRWDEINLKLGEA